MPAPDHVIDDQLAAMRDIANAALNDIGLDGIIYVDDRNLFWPHANRLECAKAARLAAFKVVGPSTLARCDKHIFSHRPCGSVTVANALLGVICLLD
jgi:hypothetical protein